MAKALIIASILVTFNLGFAHAQEDRTFEEVKAQAVREGKPLLLEFFRSDCEYCEKAKGAIEKEESIQSALEAVVYYPVNVLIGEGVQISEDYRVGTTYPVFILTNSNGDVIKRWVGFSNPRAFLGYLDAGLSNPVTIDRRIGRLETSPTLEDVLFLANYHEETQQYLEAVGYFRKAETFQKNRRLDYSYQIFENTANAIWNDLMPFDSIFPVADEVMERGNPDNIRKVAIIMLNLARRNDHFDGTKKYVQAGLDVTANAQDRKFSLSHENIMADYKLHFEGDSAAASQIKISILGPGWNKSPNKVLQLARWYAEREVYLDSAYRYCSWLLSVANDDKQQAQVYSIVAMIYDARGDLDKAFTAAKKAVELDADHPFYQNQFDEFLERMGR